ncbi:MAG: hypothetical protein RSB77_00515 [Bacilli bacterium]
MHTVIIDIIKKIITISTICLASLSSGYNINEERINIRNIDSTKISKITNQISAFETIYEYNYKIPYGQENILVKGKNGVSFVNFKNKQIILQEKTNQIVQIGMGKIGYYNGIITGYGPDCVGCDGRGLVSCSLKDGSYHSLKQNGINYTDSEFGNIRILAADQREFPCGTIIELSNSEFKEPVFGVVLDTGYSMRKAYEEGTIHIDMAFQSESGLSSITNKNTNFTVKRWGW